MLLLNPPLITCTLEHVTLVQGSKVWMGTMAIKKKNSEREKNPIKSLNRTFKTFITCIIFNQCTKFSHYSSNSLIEKQHKKGNISWPLECEIYLYMKPTEILFPDDWKTWREENLFVMLLLGLTVSYISFMEW